MAALEITRKNFGTEKRLSNNNNNNNYKNSNNNTF